MLRFADFYDTDKPIILPLAAHVCTRDNYYMGELSENCQLN